MLGLEYDPMQLTQLISVLMVAGLIAGFVAGLFGIGGGFVVVPALLLVFSFFGVDGEVPHPDPFTPTTNGVPSTFR